jgi:thioredoxin-like negative regulator of GroEL
VAVPILTARENPEIKPPPAHLMKRSSFTSIPAMKKAILLALAAVTSLALASDFPKGSPEFKDSSTYALSAAKKSGKPVVIVFSAAWCGPCQTMKKEVYPSAAVKAFHDKFIWAYLDIDDERNERVSKKFGVSSIPHIEFLDAQGKEIDKQIGSNSPEDFAKTLESVLAKVKKS